MRIGAHVAMTKQDKPRLADSPWATDVDIANIGKSKSRRHNGRDKPEVPSISTTSTHDKLLSRIMQVVEAVDAVGAADDVVIANEVEVVKGAVEVIAWQLQTGTKSSLYPVAVPDPGGFQ